MSKEKLSILGVSGSSRKRSYNTALLLEATRLLPANATMEVFDVSGFPLFSQDLERSPPPAVVAFKDKVRSSDAILFAAPEYNFSVTAVLKNALEWGNRPPGDNSWDDKPAAVVSASTSLRGGARAQMHLRQIMADLNMRPINRPALLIARAQEAFDADLRLKDEADRKTLAEVITALLDWTRRISK